MKESKPNIVYENLKNSIMNLELKPGQGIVEANIAAQYHVSRTPVRDALRRLEFEGFLEKRNNAGSSVALIDMDQIIDAVYMREKIELAVIEEFITTCKEADIIKLNIELAKQKRLLDNEQDSMILSKRFMELDCLFHSILFDKVGKRKIWDRLQGLNQHYHRFRLLLNLYDRKRIEIACESHAKMVEAISRKEVEETKKIYSQHLYYGVESSAADLKNNMQWFVHE